jgi:hypothetical protein
MNPRTHRRELCEVSRERVQQLNAVAPVEHEVEALMGGVEPMILEELRDLCGPRSILLHCYYHLPFTRFIYILANYYLLPLDTLNLCL